MGQLFSSEEEIAKAKAVIGSLIYHAMEENGALPDLSIAHTPLVASGWEDENQDPRSCLRQLQSDMANRAPTYLKDLIGRLSSFSDEPRLAGLVGLVVTMVMDMIYISSRRLSGVTGKPVGSLSCEQRVCELQEAMEEYLKRCRINLADPSRLRQDTDRLEGQVSLTLTQLKSCLLGGGCTSRSLRQWASGAVFHTQMLVHLAGLEGQPEPLAARAALKQYQEDLDQIIPVYRSYKSATVCVVKCRGGLAASGDASRGEDEEVGFMTALTVSDRETGRSATIPLSAMERETANIQAVERPDSPSVVSSANLNLITSDHYAQAYIDHMFLHGPVAELRSCFVKKRDNLSMLRTKPGSTSATKEQEALAEGNDGETGRYGGANNKEEKKAELERCDVRGEALKLSIMETETSEN